MFPHPRICFNANICKTLSCITALISSLSELGQVLLLKQMEIPIRPNLMKYGFYNLPYHTTLSIISSTGKVVAGVMIAVSLWLIVSNIH